MEMAVKETARVTRPALRYFGGKFRLSKWIIPEIPDHVCYVEPFGGAMGVLLNKKPSIFEVYNDLDGEVVNFFKVLRDQPEELIRQIDLTPYARDEQRLAFESPLTPLHEGGNVDIERARRLYVRCWQSHGGGRTQWRTGWRFQKTNKRGKSQVADWNETDHLWSIVSRLKNVQIENRDALDVIKNFDSTDTLFYLDPPYLQKYQTHFWAKAYMCEVGDEYHLKLGEALNSIKGMAIVSGKPSPLYDELFSGWVKKQKSVPTDFQSMTDECLWISPATVARQRQFRLEMGGE